MLHSDAPCTANLLSRNNTINMISILPIGISWKFCLNMFRTNCTFHLFLFFYVYGFISYKSLYFENQFLV